MTDIQALLDRFEYRPEWKFRWNGREVSCLMTIPDSNGSGDMITTGAARPLDPEIICSDEDFIEWMWETVRRLEAHEQGEWFRFDGEQVRNQHNDLQKMYDDMTKE